MTFWLYFILSYISDVIIQITMFIFYKGAYFCLLLIIKFSTEKVVS